MIMSFTRFTERKIQMAFTEESVVVTLALCHAIWCLRSRWRTRRRGSSCCNRAFCPRRHPWTKLVRKDAHNVITYQSYLLILISIDKLVVCFKTEEENNTEH